MALPLVLLLFYLSHVSGTSVVIGTRSSNAICVGGSQYAWTTNARGDSPCALAASVIAPCSSTGSWAVPPLTNTTMHYDPPNSQSVTPCYCSWAAYNLINACTACQGFEGSISPWLSFSQNCGSKISQTTYYPPGTGLDVEIPYYAIQNPMNWTGERFNVTEAISQSQDHSDINPSENPSSSSNTATNTASSTVTSSSSPASTSSSTERVPIGAIAGGVVGGLTVICLCIIAVIWLLRQRRPGNENGDDHDARTGLLKPEEIIHPFPYSNPSSPPASIPRVKSPDSVMTSSSVPRTHITSTDCTYGSLSRPLSSVLIIGEPLREPLHVSPESSLPTNPPPYTHTPQMETILPQFLSRSQGVARSEHGHGLSRGETGSPWSSFGSSTRGDMVGSNPTFAFLSRAASPPLRSPHAGSHGWERLRNHNEDDPGAIVRMIA